MKRKVKTRYTVEDFINFLLKKYDVSLESINNYVKLENSEYKNIIDIFDLSNERQIELCMSLLSLISIRYPNTILLEFRKENALIDKKINEYLSPSYIEKNKVLLLSALIKNIKFANCAYFLCSCMGRVVYDKTKEYIQKVSCDRFAIRDVPEEYQLDNDKICLRAVKYSGRALKDVKNRTFKVCLEAVRKYGWALEELTGKEGQEGKINEFSIGQIFRICKEAVNSRGASLQYIFPNGSNIFSFTEKQITEICNIAIKNNGLALEDVPLDIRKKNEELCLTAIRQNSIALKNVPPDVEWDRKKAVKIATEQQKAEVEILDAEHISEVRHIIDGTKKKIIYDYCPDNYLHNKMVVFTPKIPGTIRENSYKGRGLEYIYMSDHIEEIQSMAFADNENITVIILEKIPDNIDGNCMPSQDIIDYIYKYANFIIENYEDGKATIINIVNLIPTGISQIERITAENRSNYGRR